MRQNIKKLSELTEELSSSPIMRKWVADGGDVVTAYSLMYVKNIAVADCYMPAGSALPIHRHDELELLVPYYGQLRVEINNVETVVNVGDCFRIEPGVGHIARADVDTHLIGITIPRSEAYPHDR